MVEENTSTYLSGAPLPLSSLSLLVGPLRLLSAAMWHTIQHKVVAHYGKLEEFVSMVTDIVPELLSSQQKAQLVLGLRARLIMELCLPEAAADSEIVQPHLDRMETLISARLSEARRKQTTPIADLTLAMVNIHDEEMRLLERQHDQRQESGVHAAFATGGRRVGATNPEVPHSEFVDLVKNLLKNPKEKEHFFQNNFTKEFSLSYDEELHSLMWLFLSRLEKFLPLQTFQQVASMLGDCSPFLEDSMELVCQVEDLKALLLYQKDLCQLDHDDSFVDGSCIVSALKLPSVERTEACVDLFTKAVLCVSDLSQKKAIRTTRCHQTSETNTEQANWTPGKDESPLALGDKNLEKSFQLTKDCCVQLKKLDMPLSLHPRPVRANRGLKMREILQEEKKGFDEETTAVDEDDSWSYYSNEDSSQDSAGSDTVPKNTRNDDEAWSYYSDEDSGHKTSGHRSSLADSWSYYSSDESSLGTPENEEPFLMDSKDVSGSSKSKASTPKQTRLLQCFVCKYVAPNLRGHIKSHFPSGDYTCPQCDSRFKYITGLKIHMKKVCYEYGQQYVDPEKTDELVTLYKCDKCEKAFKYKVSLEKHVLTHYELYCVICRKVLQDATTLARHKMSHTAFQCNRCDESFTLFKHLLIHCRNFHKITRPFKCNRCPKMFTRLRLLIVHEWYHTGHLPFQCTQCSLRFKCDADLVYHERVHTREKPYLCTECGKMFGQRSNLLRHLSLIHGEGRNQKNHKCTQCEKSFKEKGALKKHQRTAHLHELFRSPCPYCGKMLSSSTIKRHKLIHTGEKPFKCTKPECDKYYRSISEVRKHFLNHHSTERPYKCTVCGKGFVKMCFLNTHAKIHMEVKPFICHICGKTFNRSSGMLRHIKLIHTKS
ncbi:uncharacterized protein KZ484_021163 [Pholidichthys leucotaenia]